ncbi:MAG: hypothetical protein OEM15_00755 [Myxococcales bacterium]|nr:hypothetical protein [Myxococcales bacterium]MDH3485382.1 hypothetical protein [Myxococcales bacterium]
MTARSTILIGLLLCSALLAGTHLTPAAPNNGGECKAVEIQTNEAGHKSGYHLFEARGELYTWFVHDGKLVVESGSDTRVEFAQRMIGSFKCSLPTP